ncbi:MAG TPA: hypothetical protein VK591_09230, partial [Xanthobacteraceae bacterium]|nr:hypothetical protein [Xanthobacteraceae bacterium]
MSWDKPLLGALRVDWELAGQLALDETGKVCFPKVPAKAGVYQFRIERSGGRLGRYVGESDNLTRRFGNYRNPGPTQKTSLRVNALLKELLTLGELIRVAIVTDRAWILQNNREILADLR